MRAWLERVQEIVENEDIIVVWYEVLVSLYRQGESPREAADWVLALDSGD